MFVRFLSISALLFASTAHAALRRRLGAIPVPPKVSSPPPTDGLTADVNSVPPYDTLYYFDQLVDHNNPSAGTFQQRYYHTWEYYEPGGPIILFTPGEVSADGYDGYLTNKTVNGLLAQQEHGATVVLEHRFFGLSQPKSDLSDKSLELLTIQQAIDDLDYFANNVVLPMPGGDAVQPGKAPWVLIGGSYSGALTSYTVVKKPGLFAAAYASSAVVEAIVYYWGYFEPIREYMPQNCSSDVQAVIAYIDETFTSGNQQAIKSIEKTFNMTLSHLDDFAGALRENLWDWQSLSPDSGPDQLFFQFCDALEVKNGVSAPPSGWGLDHALEAWGSYWTNTYYALACGDQDPETCFGTYDPTQDYFTNTTIPNDNRAWEWMVCNQFGFLQDGAPEGHPTLVTRLVQPAYDERQCTYFFPDAFPTARSPNADATNAAYDGWFVHANNLFFANGHRDPWREATLSADGTNFQSTSQQPIDISDGFHCSDLITKNAQVDSTVESVQKAGLEALGKWVSEWKPSKS